MGPRGMRFIVIMVFLAVLLLAAVPLIILLDLANGGTGWGICPEGLAGCRASFFSGPRLALILSLAVIGLLALVRGLVWVTARRASRRDVEHHF